MLSVRGFDNLAVTNTEVLVMAGDVSSQETIAQAAEAVRTCFVIAPIGEDGSPTRVQSDQVLKHIIRKALEPRYKVERADKIDRPGTITVQVIQRVFDADLVVADLSGRNANVFYELAIRHATKKSSVHIVHANEEIPFDINQIRAIKFDLTNPDSIDEAQGRLRKQVDAIESGEKVMTPVQFAQILRSLESGESRDQQIFEVLQGFTTGMSSLKSEVRDMLLWMANYLVNELSPTQGASLYSPFARALTGHKSAGLDPGFRFPSAGFAGLKKPAPVEAAKPSTSTEEKKDKKDKPQS
jgi:hypothetical protein